MIKHVGMEFDIIYNFKSLSAVNDISNKGSFKEAIINFFFCIFDLDCNHLVTHTPSSMITS